VLPAITGIDLRFTGIRFYARTGPPLLPPRYCEYSGWVTATLDPLSTFNTLTQTGSSFTLVGGDADCPEGRWGANLWRAPFATQTFTSVP
jgi:hypothetical protein